MSMIPAPVRDFLEVGGLLGMGLGIGMLCSRIGGVWTDYVGIAATLVLFLGMAFPDKKSLERSRDQGMAGAVTFFLNIHVVVLYVLLGTV
eukprot:CAMPEP_0172161350 /NCGR_PEP_ID=MMETSP1050-20130122/6080_1 /TAXON_ID=233186 /ORGANISM="Cryptomonas curvata, Strain CCAP979/52" /LENGTH=89 /DNA_ID=CAMNT_0012831245 /DNA_START=42 /DNA_END=311 /DNA_ORIENTATION=+